MPKSRKIFQHRLNLYTHPTSKGHTKETDKIMTPEERNNKMEENPLHPFKTPDGYFDSFKDRLMTRIAEEEIQVIPKTRKHLDVLRPYIYIAAAIAGLVLVLNLMPNVFQERIETQENTDLRAEDLSEEQFQQFLLDDTTEDYWGTILLENIDDNNVISSSR